MARPACLLLVVTGLAGAAVCCGYGFLETRLGAGATFVFLAVPSAAATGFDLLYAREEVLSRWQAGLHAAATIAGCVLFSTSPALQGPALGLLAVRLAGSLAGTLAEEDTRPGLLAFLWKRPALLVVSTFSMLSVVGGLLLKLPLCTVRPITYVDAFFTSVSASCVTGLIVLDTPRDFTLAGQVVILGLIQVGGLGIMTLSAFATVFLGRSASSSTEAGLADVVGGGSPRATMRVLKAIFIWTLILEALGTLLLFPLFLGHVPTGLEAFWKALFHSVSAFCNAGFALQSDSLIPYNGSSGILLVLSVLVILGGAGFGVLTGVWDRIVGRGSRTSLHTKLSVLTTAILLAVGWALFCLLEWNGSLRDLSLPQKAANAWFQAVTPRTAGFNSLDYSLLKAPTCLLFMFLMFVGGGPASTAGGIKTTTAAVLFVAVRAALTQAPEPAVFGRRLAHSVTYRAAAVLALASATVLVGLMLLLVTQEDTFINLTFEAFSAFGTVGLSLGATLRLDAVGKIIIMGLMLAGRTGSLTLGLLLYQPATRGVRYPEEEVVVG